MAKTRAPRVLETAFARYTIAGQVGQGGTGTIFKAVDETGAEFAIKILDSAKANSERRRRFKNELTFGLRNQHKNVVTVLDHGVEVTAAGSSPFYVMPLYGGSLRSLMLAGIRPQQALPLFAQILDGVEAAHLFKVTHRDMKPENVLHDSRANNLIVADFGIAEFAQEELFTLVDTAPGTRLANFMYAAPEQKVRGAQCSPATDIFALGLILNELFTRAVPHGTGYVTIGSLNPELAYLDGLVEWMIQQDINRRPQSVEQIKTELIGRLNGFVERQELDRLKQTVIPVSELDDPIESNPIRVVDARIDDNGVLILTLNQVPNEKWVQILKFGGYGRHSAMEAPPEGFSFSGNTASIRVRPGRAQDVVNYFKGWLQPATSVYIEKRRQEIATAERKQREALQSEIRAREERQSVNAQLEI